MPPPLTLRKIQLLRFLSICASQSAIKSICVAMLRHHVAMNISTTAIMDLSWWDFLFCQNQFMSISQANIIIVRTMGVWGMCRSTVIFKHMRDTNLCYKIQFSNIVPYKKVALLSQLSYASAAHALTGNNTVVRKLGVTLHHFNGLEERFSAPPLLMIYLYVFQSVRKHTHIQVNF